VAGVVATLAAMAFLVIEFTGLATGWSALSSAGVTERVSVGNLGEEANQASGSPVVSQGGRFVAFQSEAWNLVPGDTNGVRDVFVHDRQTGATERVSVDSFGRQAENFHSGSACGISADGRYVAFGSLASNLVPGDTNNTYDVFVRDR